MRKMSFWGSRPSLDLFLRVGKIVLEGPRGATLRAYLILYAITNILILCFQEKIDFSNMSQRTGLNSTKIFREFTEIKIIRGNFRDKATTN